MKSERRAASRRRGMFIDCLIAGAASLFALSRGGLLSRVPAFPVSDPKLAPPARNAE